MGSSATRPGLFMALVVAVWCFVVDHDQINARVGSPPDFFLLNPPLKNHTIDLAHTEASTCAMVGVVGS